MKRGIISEDNSTAILIAFLFLILFVIVFFIRIASDVFLLSPLEDGYGYGEECGDIVGFAEGTKIFMGDGSYENIEDIAVGDEVMGYDFVEDEQVPKEVLDIIRCYEDDLIEIVFSKGGDLITTEGLFIYTSGGWKEVGFSETPLKIGDELVNDATKEVLEINLLEKTLLIYRLVVDGDKYFIDDPIMVSNSPCVADCSGKDCGDDGCGGSCGECGDRVCEDGECVGEGGEEEIEEVENEEVEEEVEEIEEPESAMQEESFQTEKPKKGNLTKYLLMAGSGLVILILLGIVLYLIYKILTPSGKSKRGENRHL